MKGFLLKLAAAGFFIPVICWVSLAYARPHIANTVFIYSAGGIWIVGLLYFAFSRLSQFLRQKVAAWRERFVTCQCGSCGNFVEFPLDGAGQTIQCPHCSASVLLIETVERSERIRPAFLRTALQVMALLALASIVAANLDILTKPAPSATEDKSPSIIQVEPQVFVEPASGTLIFDEPPRLESLRIGRQTSAEARRTQELLRQQIEAVEAQTRTIEDAAYWQRMATEDLERQIWLRN